MLEVFGQYFAGKVRNAAFVRKGEFPGEFVDGYPGNIHRFLVRIVLDGELAPGSAQQVVVDRLVDPVAAYGEPVVDAAQRSQDFSVNAGLFGDFAHGGLLVVFPPLGMAFRQAPFQTAAPIKAGNNRNPQFAVGRVHHDAAGGDFLNRWEGSRCRVRCRRDVSTDCRRQRWVCPPAGGARYWMGHAVHSNDSCPVMMTGTWLEG